MIKVLIIAWIVFLIVRMLRASARRRFAQYQSPRQVDAVETVKCPSCGTFVAEGAQHECGSVE